MTISKMCIFNWEANYRALGSYDQAMEEFTKANALNPADPTADLLISRTYATVGEYAKAVQYAESAVKAGPSDPNLIGNLGVMYYSNVDWPDAVKELSLTINGGTTDDGQKLRQFNSRRIHMSLNTTIHMRWCLPI